MTVWLLEPMLQWNLIDSKSSNRWSRYCKSKDILAAHTNAGSRQGKQ